MPSCVETMKTNNFGQSVNNVMRNKNINLFFLFYSILGVSLYGYEQSKKSRILLLFFICTTIWRIFFIIITSFIMYLFSDNFVDFYSIFVQSIKTQPLMKFSFIWSWRFLNLSNIVLIILFTFNGNVILKCFNNFILIKYLNNHTKMMKIFIFRLFGFIFLLLFVIAIFFQNSNDFTYLQVIVCYQIYFGYTYMIFFYDLNLLMFLISKKILIKLKQKLDKINDNNLAKNDTFELINDIKALGYNLYEFNRISSPGLFLILITTVFSYLNNIVVFISRTEIHGHRMIYFHFFMNILRTICICILSWTSQYILKQFDDIYFCLLDKSINTLRNNYSKYQKYSKAITISNSLQIYELIIIRHYYKSYYFYEILPMCLESLGFIFIFIFQYIIIFIETTLIK
ncbi:hypothetical protein DERP_010578 [Dermatophagoides pteronyssinus]|uniref:Gustatory receptor n=1 Tax=Dermatophagoides pteronyssinus TaxID=6956 RepID=A0ABQ8JFQ7_DERPT|nr:hypothetical protein DERP_010578 [Dermatophagoides pteronyssinus]